MKGIRKLFLGLFLVTLFGVGFKVELNAATPTFTPASVTDWTTSGTAFTGYVKFEMSDFNDITDPSSGQKSDPKHCTIQIKEATAGGIGTSIDIYLWKYNNSGNVENHYGSTAPTIGNEGAVLTEGTFNSDTASATITQVVDLFGARTSSNADITKSFYLDYTLGDTSDNSIPVTSYGVTCNTDPESTSTNGLNASIRNGEKKSLLPGESTVVEAFISTQNNRYRSNDTWTLNKASSLGKGFANGKAYNKIKQTENGSATVTANFTNDASLSIPGVKNQNFTPGQSISTSYIFTGYKGNEVFSTSGITGGAFQAGSSGTFTGTAPTTTGSQTLNVTMQDGNVFTIPFTVHGIGDVEFASTPICITYGKSVNLTAWTDYDDEDTLINSIEIKGKARGYAKLVVGTSEKDKITNGLLSDIKIKGTEITSGTKASEGKEKIIMSAGTIIDDEAKITVYPLPDVELNVSSSTSSTSSGSSPNSSIKVIMPTGVYYDDEGYDVIKAKIVLSTSKGKKEITREVKTSNGDDGLSKYTLINSTEYLDWLDGICDDEKDPKVTIKVYPIKGSTADSNIYYEREFTAHRISLDTSAGAKYTVDGLDVGGHFYGIEEARYNIKSSPTNGGTLDKNNSGEFNSGESITYKVLGARTLKAVYNNGSSSSPSSSSPSTSGRNAATAGEGMDDYDDVPKTGESKADIWILWSVLFVSILGAGFMIWKRFGLVRAIAEADEEVAVAEHKEEVKAKKKEKEDKIKMLKDLRNL